MKELILNDISEIYTKYLNLYDRSLPISILRHRRHYKGFNLENILTQFLIPKYGLEDIDKDCISDILSEIAERKGFLMDSDYSEVPNLAIHTALSKHTFNYTSEERVSKLMSDYEFVEIDRMSALFINSIKSRNPDSVFAKITAAIMKAVSDYEDNKAGLFDVLETNYCIYYNVFSMVLDETLDSSKLIKSYYQEAYAGDDLDFDYSSEAELPPLIFLDRVLRTIITIMENSNDEVRMLEKYKNEAVLTRFKFGSFRY